MTVPLDEIAKSLFEKSANLSSKDSSNLQAVIACGNTLVEFLQYLVDHSSKENSLILQTVLDEIFLDLHISVTLSMGGQYKAACVLLRTCIEISLYVLYFIGHPIEARMWADTPQESGATNMTFSQTLEKITSSYYAKAASSREPHQKRLLLAKDQLQTAYRLLSERVHGKYAFLQSTSSGSDSLIPIFSKLALDSLESLISLGIILSAHSPEIKKTVPALEKYL